MAEKESSVEANGIKVTATPNVVWLEGEETVKLVTRTELRETANVDRV